MFFCRDIFPSVNCLYYILCLGACVPLGVCWELRLSFQSEISSRSSIKKSRAKRCFQSMYCKKRYIHTRVGKIHTQDTRKWLLYLAKHSGYWYFSSGSFVCIVFFYDFTKLGRNQLGECWCSFLCGCQEFLFSLLFWHFDKKFFKRDKRPSFLAVKESSNKNKHC